MRKEIVGKNKDGAEVKVFVKTPSPVQLKKATLIAAKYFADALNAGCLLKAKTEKALKDQGLWGDEQIDELREISKRINENESKLKKGGIKKSEAVNIAYSMREDRQKQAELLGILNSLDSKTAEGLSQDARFDYLCSTCIVDEEGNPICKSVEDYQDRSSNGDEFLNEAALEFSALFFGYDKDWQLKLPENKFFKDQGMVDEKFRLVNKEGQLVDRKGRRVNENYQLINEDGKAIDENGKLVDENGEEILEFSPFLED